MILTEEAATVKPCALHNNTYAPSTQPVVFTLEHDGDFQEHTRRQRHRAVRDGTVSPAAGSFFGGSSRGTVCEKVAVWEWNGKVENNVIDGMEWEYTIS